MALLISIVVIILFALKWFIERIRFTAIIYYIVEKRLHSTKQGRTDGVHQNSFTENGRRTV